ncbi:hypothetical protein ABIA16_003549 [Sinorhizobium fredii]
MSINNGPAFVVGQGLYNFAFIRARFEKQLAEQGHPAADIEFQAVAMTVMHVLHKIRTAYLFGVAFLMMITISLGRTSFICCSISTR